MFMHGPKSKESLSSVVSVKLKPYVLRFQWQLGI